MLRSIPVSVVGAAFVLALASPALAQTPATTPAPAPQTSASGRLSAGDIEGGVALFNRVTNKGQDETYGPGWYVGGSYQITPAIAIMGSLTADYDKVGGRTANIYTYAGGPRFQWKRTERFRPFFQVLFGSGQDNGIFGASSSTNHYPMLSPGAGTDVAISDRVVIRVRFDVPLLMRFSDTYVGTRLGIGLSVPIGSR